MTPSRPLSHQIDARSGPLRFATPARLGIIAVIAMAVVAIALSLVPLGDAPPLAGVSPSASASAEPTVSLEPSSTPAPTLAPSPTIAPTPKPTPTPLATWTGLIWSDPVTPPFTVHLTDLVPWGDGYVAAGWVETDPGAGGALLTSPDGLNWTVAYQTDPASDRWPRQVVALGDQLFAFTNPNMDTRLAPDARPPIVWRSPDGTNWTLVESASWRDEWAGLVAGPMPASWDHTQYDIPTGLVDVASGPDGLVAIGNSYGDDEVVPILLHSTDGSTWTDVSQSVDMPSALLESVVAYQGGFVAVGAVEAGPQTETATPAAWVSADGLAWSGTAVDVAPVIGAEFGRVVAGNDGLVAWAGAREMHSGPRFTSAWTSPDGLAWSPAETPFSLFDRVAGDGTRIVALGPMPGLASDPAQWPGISEGWVSTDGATWTPMSQSRVVDDMVEAMWVVPDGVIYAGVQSFWFGTAIER